MKIFKFWLLGGFYISVIGIAVILFSNGCGSTWDVGVAIPTPTPTAAP